MNEGRDYGSPTAFRQALTDKLKAKAKEGPWTLAQLQRQMAYDRLLERLYLTSEDWIVKGATALLARDIGVRATIDIDLYRGRRERSPRQSYARAPQRTSATGSPSRLRLRARLPTARSARACP